MRDTENVFHLAIPCADLAAAEAFYVEKMGCTRARKYEDRITLNFFGDQVVCHLAPDEIDPAPKLYPRHFGITFRRREPFDGLLARVRERGIELFREPTTRFPGRPEEHLTFFLKDPSNNVLEFKFYHRSQYMY